jgi:hypothetical protein
MKLLSDIGTTDVFMMFPRHMPTRHSSTCIACSTVRDVKRTLETDEENDLGRRSKKAKLNAHQTPKQSPPVASITGQSTQLFQR